MNKDAVVPDRALFLMEEIMDTNLDIINKEDTQEAQKRRLTAYKDALDKPEADKADKETKED